MGGQYEELSGAEKALAAARARGDFVINSALDWIDRFYMQSSEILIMELTKGIRSLSKAMHSRSADDIMSSINALLKIQTRLMLPGGQNQEAIGAFTQVSAVPRAHKAWSPSEYFSPEEHRDRPEAQKHGRLFVSYARADSQWLSRLMIHLRPLERAGRIEVWHDGRLESGDTWRVELADALNEASCAILLVSANFMASDFIYTNELQPIATRVRAHGVIVFPVMVGHCLFEEDRYLKDVQMFNDPERPLSRLESSEVDETLVKLARAVRALSE